MLSVRARITLVAALLSGVTLVVASMLLVRSLDHSLTHDADDTSRARIAELARTAASGRLPGRLGDAGDGVVQVVSGGQVIAASTNVLGRPPISTFVPAGRTPELTRVNGAPDDSETEDYRVWAATVPAAHGLAVVYVGRSLESVHEATATLRRMLYLGVPMTLLVLLGTTWLLVGRALRPVEQIRAEVAGISAEGLDRRVAVPATADEVSRLARTMNVMLGRLELARRREQDFVADASHELLSPLAASRAMLEADLHPNPDAEPDADSRAGPGLVRGLLAENATMEGIVRDLLYLAHEQPTAAAYVPLDLDDLVLEEVARLRAVAAVALDTSAVSAAPVRGDREGLRRLVRNLLENAARHAASRVTVGLAADDGAATLTVADDGPGVAAADRPHVFDRFYRGGHARDGGAGLGLAIARTVALRHAGDLRLAVGDTAADSGADTGARFVATLPLDGAGGGRP